MKTVKDYVLFQQQESLYNFIENGDSFLYNKSMVEKSEVIRCRESRQSVLQKTAYF